AAILATLLIRYYWRRRPYSAYAPYSRYWESVSRPTVWQISWLWVGLEPSGKLKDGTPAYPIFQMLKSDLDRGVLSGEKVEGSWIWTKIDREQLKQYALKKDEKPAFLFSERKFSIISLRIYNEFLEYIRRSLHRAVLGPRITRGRVTIWQGEGTKTVELDRHVNPNHCFFHYVPSDAIHAELNTESIYFERRDLHVDSEDVIFIEYQIVEF
ncbi:MAG: hypothetical protein KDA62_20100, partial [Planctomycetales bacterium]|nr:hypothetical protein [Planctomycetales bacterium]